MSEPLDMPDGPGWWAFRGTYTIVQSNQVEMTKQIIEWVADDPQPYYRFDGDWYPVALIEERFKETYNGKWYRLTMPWEVQTAIPPDVRDAIRKLADYGMPLGATNHDWRGWRDAALSWLDAQNKK